MNTKISDITPSLFTKFPMNSVEQNCETEQIAVNIMVILKRTGNKFRKLSWQEYAQERKKDGGFSDREHEYFDKAIKYCDSPTGAIRFCEKWRKSAETFIK